MHTLMTWVEAQHSPGMLLVAGAFVVFVGLTVLRIVGRIRRLIWAAGVVAVAGGMGTGGGWNALHTLTQLR